MDFLQFDNLKFRYEPFPIGLAKPVVSEELYARLVDNFPPIDIFNSFEEMGKKGRKFTLSEREDKGKYLSFINSSPLWMDFYKWVKSDDFCYQILDALTGHNIDLGYQRAKSGWQSFEFARALLRGKRGSPYAPLSARFEFSALPADGGSLVPHTDSPSKIVTLIVSMCREGEWNPALGGGTDMCRHKDPSKSFNFVNHLVGFDDVEVLHTFEYTPNQAIVFVKTFNSWHSVRPMTGNNSDVLRKTLTIVIEALA